jgi:hypothetical protein
MLNSSQKAFAQLCESFINEDASQIPKALGSNGVAARAITKFIHSKFSLSDKAVVKTLSGPPNWSDVKKSNSWIIVQGENGYGAIKVNRDDRYQVGAVKLGNEVVQTMSPSSVAADISKFLKPIVGKVIKYHAVAHKEGAGRWDGRGANKFDVRDVQARRKKAQAGTSGAKGEVNLETIFTKFKPMFTKAAQAAEADAQGIAATMLKSGNYEGVEKKLRTLNTLRLVSQLMSESPPAANADYSIRADYSRSHEFVKNTLSKAAQHAAVHFYKDEIGDEEELLSQFTIHNTADDLVEKLFNDIANGDTKKLSGLLWYFKNGLVR